MSCARLQLREISNQPWVEAKTEHIRVRTTLTAADAKSVAVRLERERRELLLMWGDAFNPKQVLEVLVLRRYEGDELFGKRATTASSQS